MLQRSDNRVARALENANDAAFTSIFRCLSASDFGAPLRDIETDPCDDAVAVHRSAGIFCRDKNIRLTRFLWNQKTVTRLMDRQFPGHEIGFGGKDVTVLTNADDLAGMFQLGQSFAHRNAVPALQSERSRDLISIARPVIRRTQERQHFFSNCATVFAHVGESILKVVDLTAKYEKNYYCRMYDGGSGDCCVCSRRSEDENQKSCVSRRWHDSGEIQQE